MEQKQKKSLKKWWKETRPSKTVVFWLLLAAVILTVVVGFFWGGWTTNAAAQKLAAQTAKDAVVERLSSICTTQFDQDPGREAKLEELRKASSYSRSSFVEEQGWATMPGEQRPDRGVAQECARLLLLNNP
jgi:predicted negative regulator of RcsB-dependent stress response